ncbi:DUF1513 domain-containing protein [Paracoccus tegillarcae]|uniref:DUF1513 domain-containing protein n=1 Tax=Paracoccus tegillarcae TaxID=1529068 RepID=A0A2K9EJE9_9RHOB|nr:DUF1513 domain-containing protein [Paracoccus tegillarcae]AUH34509.1 DUF1513 domain-containing protein [Paracoccus tegillarcae]
MATSRRRFLGALLAASAIPRLSWADAGSPAFLACAREPDDSFALYGLSAAGEDRFRVRLPARGHAGAGHPLRPEAVVFARRPGTYALVIDCAGGKVMHRLTPPEGRQFNGHGVYLDGGDVLVTTEQRSSDSVGMLGYWSVAEGYRRIDERPTGGIGPHEVVRLSDNLLAVANGGIATDPSDRRKLNIAVMRPNLAYLDGQGTLIRTVELAEDLRFNSIRHLAVGADGIVAFAMQWERDPDEVVPLLGLHRGDGAPILAAAPPAEQRVMQGYAGSIAFDLAGSEVAITSPRGGRLHRFRPDGRFIAATTRADACGLAGISGGFLLTDGGGGVLTAEQGRMRSLGLRRRSWDNHVIALNRG